MKLEGIVSKRAEAPYRSGRVKGWLKTKYVSPVTLMKISRI